MDLAKLKDQQRALRTHEAEQRELSTLHATFHENLPTLRNLVAREMATLDLDVAVTMEKELRGGCIVVKVPASSHSVTIEALSVLSFKPEHLRSEFEVYPYNYELGVVVPHTPLALPVIVKNGEVLRTLVSSMWWRGPSDNERLATVAKLIFQGRTGPREIRASNCFVATAIFGDSSEEVAVLRRWRDGTLSRSLMGRAVVTTYYQVGPLCAALVRKHAVVERLLRRMLLAVCDRLQRRE